MDRHNVPDEVTPEMAAQLHAADSKIQHLFNCTVLTYWYDNSRKTAFCLVDAPNPQALQGMHNASHGQVAHNIIEVDPDIVESFLGRIEHPSTGVPINEPAFRVIMVVEMDRASLKINENLKNFSKEIVESILHYEGRIVRQDLEQYLVSFFSASAAVQCAFQIESIYNKFINRIANEEMTIKIALSGDAPVTEHENFFEQAIKLAGRMCKIDKALIMVSSEVRDLYISEQHKVFDDKDSVYCLTTADEKFLNHLMEYTEKVWAESSLKTDDFYSGLAFSKSQLYRKMMSLIGKSPNMFLKDYRLKEALKLLNKQKGNISEIAFNSGFNSLSYFTKCFQKKYNISPSDYVKSKI